MGKLEKLKHWFSDKTEEEIQAGHVAAKRAAAVVLVELCRPDREVKQFPIEEGGFIFVSDPEYPGMIVQKHWDGRKAPGRLKDGKFVPAEG